VFEGDLMNQETEVIQEDVYGFLHKAEVSVAALCEKLGWLIVMDKDQATKLDSTQTQSVTAKEEVVRLKDQVKGLHGLKKKMEERGKRVTELEKKVTELEAALQKAEEEFTEKMANEAASTYGVGFEAALEQVRLLCPSANISVVDANKAVLDGRLVDSSMLSCFRTLIML